MRGDHRPPQNFTKSIFKELEPLQATTDPITEVLWTWEWYQNDQDINLYQIIGGKIFPFKMSVVIHCSSGVCENFHNGLLGFSQSIVCTQRCQFSRDLGPTRYIQSMTNMFLRFYQRLEALGAKVGHWGAAIYSQT